MKTRVEVEITSGTPRTQRSVINCTQQIHNTITRCEIRCVRLDVYEVIISDAREHFSRIFNIPRGNYGKEVTALIS